MFEDLFEEEIISKIEDYLKQYKDKDAKHEDREETLEVNNTIINDFEEIILNINKEIQDLIAKRDYNRAERFISIVKRLGKIKDKLLENLSVRYSSNTQKDKKQVEKTTLDKKFTPMEEFYLPILETLYELGGKGTIREVIQKVGIKMKDILTPYDYEYLKSGKEIRWENKAQWARFALVQKGLLKKDSPRGIWELSEEGYKYILEVKKIKLWKSSTYPEKNSY